jgi:DNA polymerase-3 subunit beta
LKKKESNRHEKNKLERNGPKMKIAQRELSQKVRQLKNVVPPRNSGSNQGILLKNNLLMANNLELGMTAALDAGTQEEFVLPPKAIDMIEWLPDGMTDIHNAGETVIIESACGKACFQTFPVSEFNEINIKEEKTGAFACGGDTAGAIGKVMYACAADNIKPALNGVFLDCDGERLNIVACDGYRLAWNQIQYPEKFTAAIPKASLQKALSIGSNSDFSLCLGDKNNAVIKSGDYAVYTRLLGGHYIDYRQMFKEYPIKVIAGRSELLDSLSRSLICMDDKYNTPVILAVSGKTMHIGMKTSISDFSETVKLENPAPGEFEIAFNPRYLADTLRAFDEETLEFHYSMPTEPVIVCGENMKALVLPVRLKS